MQFLGPQRMFRLAFDSERPLVATSAFQASDRVVQAGDVFDWRAHGMTEIEALALFRSGVVAHSIETPDADALSNSDLERLTAPTTPTTPTPPPAAPKRRAR